MRTVRSKDGTTIAFDQTGQGAAVILVTGALGTRASWGELTAALAPHFTVYAYDRRGRDDSTDTPPFAPQREIEDLDALLDAAGGSAFVYGISSGAVLALEAANALPTKVKKLAMYEPPFIVDDSRPPLPIDYVEQINTLVAAKRRGDAVTLFMTEAVGVPAEYLPQMQGSPMWSQMEAVAHTIAYDGAIMEPFMSGKPLPTNRWTAVTMPALIMDGGESPEFFHSAARSLVALLPNARYVTLEGQNHGVATAALAPMLIDFFTES